MTQHSQERKKPLIKKGPSPKRNPPNPAPPAPPAPPAKTTTTTTKPPQTPKPQPPATTTTTKPPQPTTKSNCYTLYEYLKSHFSTSQDVMRLR